MKDKPKLTLVSDNPNLKTYYVPLTTIHVDMYPVKANSLEEAIVRANAGFTESIARRITLEETKTNDSYMEPFVDSETLFARQIESFSIDIKNYDETIPSV